MDPPDPFSAGGNPSPGRRIELQGPRPAPLKVNKDSYQIKKPPVAPQRQHRHHHHDFHQLPPRAPSLPPAGTAARTQNPQPVIIYAVSPKVIKTTVSDFMNLVQRLTGSSSSSSTTTSDDPTGFPPSSGDVSPAARLASIEKASPSERERAAAVASAATFDETTDDLFRILEETNVQMGQNMPSILSPAPATLPSISPAGLFSPAGIFSPAVTDPFSQVSNMFIPSPSTLFSAPMASPSPSSTFDVFNIPFFDF